MQKITAFFLSFIAMFLCFFWGYNDTRVQDRLNPGVEEASITSDVISLKMITKVTASTSNCIIEVNNNALSDYTCDCEPDIEVLTDKGWFDATRTINVYAANVKGTVNATSKATVTVKNLNTYHIVGGYLYRIVLTFKNNYGDTVKAAVDFRV